MPDSLSIHHVEADSVSAPGHAHSAAPDTAFTLDIDTSLERALAMPRLCGEPDSARQAVATIVPARGGRDAEARKVELGQNSGVLSVISLVAVLMLLSYSKFRRLFALLTSNLWSLRKRANAFDDRTSNETSVFVLMAVQWSLYTGILLYILVAGDVPRPASEAFTGCMSVAGVMAGYYTAQLVAYAALGYTFSTLRGMRQLLGGFTASQSLLGFALMPVALAAIFFPACSGTMVIAGIALYALARVVFIIKGFRIFYYKISSLLYYILYLCALEVIPLIAVYQIARAAAL